MLSRRVAAAAAVAAAVLGPPFRPVGRRRRSVRPVVDLVARNGVKRGRAPFLSSSQTKNEARISPFAFGFFLPLASKE